MVTLNLSGTATETVCVVVGPVKVKSHPLPDNGIDCGLPLALSVTVSVPVRAPTTVGANVTLMMQFAPAAKVAGLIGQALAPALVAAKSPEAAIELIVNGPAPVFVSFTFIALLVVVSIWPPKGTLVWSNPTPGAVADPVPVRLTSMICAVTMPPSVTIAAKARVALSAAAAEGVNVTATVHWPPAAAPAGLHESDDFTKSVLFAGETPVTVMLVNVTVELVLFVSVNVCAGLATPTGCTPKLYGDGVTTKVGIRVSLAMNPSEVPFRFC